MPSPGQLTLDRGVVLPRPTSINTVSVIVPTRNEAGNVKVLLDRLDPLLPDGSEIIFVDDSSDDTPEVVRTEAGGRRSAVCAIHRPPPDRGDGLGGAVVVGLRAASAPYVCVIDGDLQHPPEIVPQLLAEAVETGADLVVATRFRENGDVGDFGRLRSVLSRVSAKAAHVLFPRRLRQVSDPMSGCFLVARDRIDPDALRPRGFKILLEILIRSRVAAVSEVPYTFGTRHAGETKASLTEGMRYLRQLASLRVNDSSRRAIGFAAVGSAGIAVNMAAVVALTAGLHVYYLASAFAAAQIAMTFNYALAERFVFPREGRRRRMHERAVAYFAMNNAVQVAANPVLAVLVAVVGLHYALANLITIALLAAMRFVAADRFIWSPEHAVTWRASVQPERGPLGPALPESTAPP